MSYQIERDSGFYESYSHRRAVIQTPKGAALAVQSLYSDLADVPVVDLASLRNTSDEALPSILRIRGSNIVPEVVGPELIVFQAEQDQKAAHGIAFTYHMAQSSITVRDREISDAIILGQPSRVRAYSGMAFAATEDELFIAQTRSGGRRQMVTPASVVLVEGQRVLTNNFEPISSIYGGFRDIYEGIRKIQHTLQ